MKRYIIKILSKVYDADTQQSEMKLLYFQTLHTDDIHDQSNSIILHYTYDKKKALKFIDKDEAIRFATFINERDSPKVIQY